MKKSLMFLSFIISLLLIVNSCNDEITSQDFDSIDKNELKVENGILVFNSSNSFFKTINEIANYSDAERKGWEESIGFLSQNRIISQIIEAEQEHIAPYMDLSDDELLDQENVPSKHSATFYKYLDYGVIKITDEGTENESWDYSVSNKMYTDFINIDGIFAIGDTLFQFNKDVVKIYPKSNTSNVDKLKMTNVSNEEISIIQLKTNFKSTRYFYDKDIAEADKKRISVEVYGDMLYFIESSKTLYYTYVVFIRCQEKKLFSWKDINTEFWINGKWDFRYGPLNNGWDASYNWHGNGCYCKRSVNPETGELINENSSFYVKVPEWEPWDFTPIPYFRNIYWYGLRYGGCCGLKAEIGFNF
ncbi:MAG: hypothetical protein JXA77_06185 [Bacteroidales bacterium]|nr:hypothetical protein [Bacteroidales bacterium]MBN2819811.1 hypothetical protein [Bacteroidales bacterium]